MKQYVKTDDGRWVMVGDILDHLKLFRKTVSGSKHLFHKLDAWGIDAAFFDTTLHKLKCIVLKDEDDCTYYVTSPARFKENGEYKHFTGYNAQIFLPRKYWESTKSKAELENLITKYTQCT